MYYKKILLSAITCLLLLSCSNEDFDDSLSVSPADLILKDSELFNLLEDVTTSEDEFTCINFIYSFTVVVYDENTQVETSQVVNNDLEFFNLLQSVEDGSLVGISFPITSELDDGTSFEVNNKDELQAAIAACKEEEQLEIIGSCTATLLECVWEVAIPDDVVYSTYIDAVFDVNNDGTVSFYHRGIVFEGTWIVYFIDDELHLNINLNDDDEIGADWNFDWKINTFSNILIDLETSPESRFLLNRECEDGAYCTTLNFEECELEDTPGFAEFILEDYVDCIITMAAPEPVIDDTTGQLPDPIDWDVTFHITQLDADIDVNPVNSTAVYTNSTSLDEFFVRIEHPDTQEFLVVVITLEAVSCE